MYTQVQEYHPITYGLINELKPLTTQAEYGPPPNTSNKYKPLTKEELDGIESFVLFIGYARSGHSIIGSMMDAHPDIMIAHEYFIFKKWNEQKKLGIDLLNKDKLLNELYKKSFSDQSEGLRTAGSITKGYTLQVKNSWQGRFRNLRVIGDKSGGTTSLIFHQSPQTTTKHFQEMVKTVGIPIKLFHVIRNPYDIIATEALYRDGPNHNVKSDYNETHKMDNSKGLWFAARYLFDCVSAVHQIKNDWKLTDDNLLEIYSEEFLVNPKPVIQSICTFLNLDCPAGYVQQCYDKTYKKVSRTRDRVVWPADLREWIESSMKKYDFLRGYSFDRSDYNL